MADPSPLPAPRRPVPAGVLPAGGGRCGGGLADGSSGMAASGNDCHWTTEAPAWRAGALSGGARWSAGGG